MPHGRERGTTCITIDQERGNYERCCSQRKENHSWELNIFFNIFKFFAVQNVWATKTSRPKLKSFEGNFSMQIVATSPITPFFHFTQNFRWFFLKNDWFCVPFPFFLKATLRPSPGKKLQPSRPPRLPLTIVTSWIIFDRVGSYNWVIFGHFCRRNKQWEGVTREGVELTKFWQGRRGRRERGPAFGGCLIHLLRWLHGFYFFFLWFDKRYL